jgi:two-component system CitB family sensor kinase
MKQRGGCWLEEPTGATLEQLGIAPAILAAARDGTASEAWSWARVLYADAQPCAAAGATSAPC